MRYGLERLERINVVDEDVYLADAGQNLYQLPEPPADPAEADGGVDVGDDTCAECD